MENEWKGLLLQKNFCLWVIWAETWHTPRRYIPKHHSKFHQNWWFSLGDVTGQDTEGHSFIIIRIHQIQCKQAKSQLFVLISDVERPVFVTSFGFAIVTKIHEMKLNSLEEIDFYSTIGTQSLIRLGSLTYNMNVCTLNLI